MMPGVKMFKYSWATRKNLIIGASILVSLLVLGALAGVYYYNRLHNEELAFTGKTSTWDSVELAWATASQRYKDTVLAPYFKAFYAETLYRKGDKDRALQLLKQSLISMPTSSPLYFMYATKHALLAYDNASTAESREQALKELQELADKKDNPQRCDALYQLGLLAWTNHDTILAKKWWKILVTACPHSLSAGLAEAKLNQLA
jgi:hypothetical protein